VGVHIDGYLSWFNYTMRGNNFSVSTVQISPYNTWHLTPINVKQIPRIIVLIYLRENQVSYKLGSILDHRIHGDTSRCLDPRRKQRSPKLPIVFGDLDRRPVLLDTDKVQVVVDPVDRHVVETFARCRRADDSDKTILTNVQPVDAPAVGTFVRVEN